MGLFLDRDIFTSTNTASTSNSGSVNPAAVAGLDFTDSLLLNIPSIFSFAAQVFGEDDSEEGGGGEDPEAQAKIDANQKELESVYAEASNGNNSNISSPADIQAVIDNISDSNTKINGINSELNQLTEAANGENSVDKAKANLEKYYNDVPTCNQLKAGVAEPQNKLDLINKYNEAVERETILIPQKKQELEQAKQNEITRLTALKGQAENLQDRIDKLKHNTDSNGKKYNVKKETNDIKTFMTALKAFQNADAFGKADAAKALKKAYEQGDSENGKDGVQQASVQRAYKMVLDQYPQYFQ